MQKNKSIRYRWVFTSMLITVTVTLLAIVIISLVMVNYFYQSMAIRLQSMAKTSSDFFDNYITSNYSEHYQSAYAYTEAFESKDSVELQFVNTAGRVVTSTYGITAGVAPGTPDITNAMESGAVSTWMGYDPLTGEHVMAVSTPLFFGNDQIIGLMRYVTSLQKADRQAVLVFIIALAIGTLIICCMIIPSDRFIRGIVKSIRQITDISKRIANGSYGVQIEEVYKDEIGELATVINEMSINLSSAESTKNEFISSISHELRTPLTAITGWGETLAYSNEWDDEARRGIRIILTESRRLTTMVEELLEFTRIENGKFTLNIGQTDVQAVLEDTVFTYGRFFRREGITVEYSSSDDIPVIQGDGERLKQVFLNILDNAAKHGGDGKRIEVTLAMENSEIVAKFRDFGAGIPEDELPNVKFKFYKGSSKARGSGIGLAVCEEIVTLHNGRIDIENAKESGVLVTVRLPVSVSV